MVEIKINSNGERGKKKKKNIEIFEYRNSFYPKYTQIDVVKF